MTKQIRAERKVIHTPISHLLSLFILIAAAENNNNFFIRAQHNAEDVKEGSMQFFFWENFTISSCYQKVYAFYQKFYIFTTKFHNLLILRILFNNFPHQFLLSTLSSQFYPIFPYFSIFPNFSMHHDAFTLCSEHKLS